MNRQTVRTVGQVSYSNLTHKHIPNGYTSFHIKEQKKLFKDTTMSTAITL